MGKIVIINHYGVTPDMPGSSKNYEMSRYFAKNYEIETEFWICGYNHHMGKQSEDLKGFKLQEIKKNKKHSVVKIKSTPYKKSYILRQINITVFDIITAFKILISKNIDCIVITVPPISIFNVIATKIKRIKLIANVHDLWPLFLEDMGMDNKLAISYMNFGANFLYNNADAIATVSEGMFNYVKSSKKSKNKKPMWISPLGVNVEDYFGKKQNKDIISKKIWANDFKIMYLGAHRKANDLLSVLNTINEYVHLFGDQIDGKKISFIFIGDGDQKEKAIDYTRLLGLENVYFENSVPGNEVADILSNADICLTNLMKIESFKLVRPNKLFQYMALGKPIISGIWGEFQSIIEMFGTGIYVDFTDTKEASYQINKLIKDKQSMKKMSINGKKYIEKFGDRKKIFTEFFNEIQKLIEQK